MTSGRKFDQDKPMFGLIPPYMEEEVARVLTFGAGKYAEDNWQVVPNGKKRYLNAMRRHIHAFQKGEINDPETGLHHMAHAICCAMFIGEADLLETELGPDYHKILEQNKEKNIL